ncbi:mitochondrial carrier domain-containing protein [Phycomyces blakesleeanus]|uniref:Mitochondrial carrier domain-containing protein n=1 Tax=Phycomyces blakesleeanus TaxID=4837 RepID=A0ABR3B3Q3_PHYBL
MSQQSTSANDNPKAHVHSIPIKELTHEVLWANRTIIAASSAAVVGVLAGYPFDSVKTRMQTQPYDSISACVRHTYKEEGIRGFFRGIVPPLITVSIIKSVSFSVYEKTKRYCKANYPFFNQDSLGSTFVLSTTGGVVTGAFIATLSCPFELIKIQKQLEFLLQASSISTGATVMRPMAENDPRSMRRIVKTVGAAGAGAGTGAGAGPQATSSQPKKISTSSWHSAKEIIKKKGLPGLWSGFGLHFVRDALGTGVYFGGYETTKYLLNQGSGQPAGPLTQFLAGGICGILCWLVVFPIDLVKSLMQKEIMAQRPTYGRTSDCIRDIYKAKGTLGFYRGITVTLVRAFPIHSLNFLVYEQTLLLMRYLSDHTQDQVSL